MAYLFNIQRIRLDYSGLVHYPGRVTLREARKVAGLTRAHLAELSETTTTTIYDIETGRNQRPAYETVVRIVRALQGAGLKGVTADQLFPVSEKVAS